ncbi:MAG: IPT/TIG domain-containing protein [Actinobacteria bacterium]|nr:IPT/TIG domain-containing protein [Actinomycetota bacterium]
MRNSTEVRRNVPENRRFGLVCLVASATLFLVTVLAGGIAAAQVTAPQIDNLFPDRGPVGTPVAINGSDFGGIQLTGTVTFNGVPATTIPAWYDANILALVPEGATTGPVVVTNAIGLESNGVVFEVTAVPRPDQTWYLAEGCTAYGFDTYVLMENTTDVDATVNITYNTTQYGSMPRSQPVNVPPNSRVTLHVNEEVPNVDVSTEIRSSQKIVCERAMYWNERIDGHDSIGVTQPAGTWYLAEGCTLEGFETWVLIQNPGQNNASIDVTYMTSNGTIEKDNFIVRAGQRFTIDVARDVGACDVSTKVESDQPIICERSMYWDGRRGGARLDRRYRAQPGVVPGRGLHRLGVRDVVTSAEPAGERRRCGRHLHDLGRPG